MKLRLKL